MANYRNMNTKYADKMREKIDIMRKENKLSIPELAEKANIDPCVLRNYINGRNDINSGNLIAIFKVFDKDFKF